MEITPIGIQNLQWKFYIIWVVFNLSCVPLVYFLYPETADRTLEDLDAYFRTNPPLLVFRDKSVTSSKRPAEFAVKEEEDIRRASSVDPGVFRRESRAGITSRQASIAVESDVTKRELGSYDATHEKV